MTPDVTSLVGHAEELTYLVHRSDYGDHWVLLDDGEANDDEWTMMRDRVLDMGGKLFKATARAVVIAAELVDGDEDEEVDE